MVVDVVVGLVMAVPMDVGVTSFLAQSCVAKELLKSALLLQPLPINVLVYGEESVGKATLARTILPECGILDERDAAGGLYRYHRRDSWVVRHFHLCWHDSAFLEWLRHYSGRVVATSDVLPPAEILDTLFGVVLYIPPLDTRPEDALVVEKFLMGRMVSFLEDLGFCADQNLCSAIENRTGVSTMGRASLQREIFLHLLTKVFSESEMLRLLEFFLSERMSKGDNYEKLLGLFDLPLIRAALKRSKSQLQAAKILQINRNTLRKKIQTIGGV